MIETIKEIFPLLNLPTQVVSVVIGFILLYKFFEKFYEHSNAHKNFIELQEDHKSLKNTVNDIKIDVEKIKSIVERLETTIQKSNENIVQSQSPLTLTTKGWEMAKAIDANRIFNTHKEFLKNEVYKKDPKTAYSVQQISSDVVDTMFISHVRKTDLTGLQIMEDYAYNEGISLSLLLSIFSILLRDEILKEKNIHTLAVAN